MALDLHNINIFVTATNIRLIPMCLKNANAVCIYFYYTFVNVFIINIYTILIGFMIIRSGEIKSLR